MAGKKQQEEIVIANKVIDCTVEQVMHQSMIPYAEYVILDRALPRVEDGLKPVQRRILYTMFELGLTPDKAHKKSARIVGDCLGKYHPHGDSSVYDAMVRMAQPFNMGMTLVDGHGNFGSVDGDPAAAMRYTEARMHPLAMELLRDLEKDTVKWSFNFDDTLKEPDMLPGRYPNLLVNGASGIAVGLATNIPPHNITEVIDGVIAYIDKPRISLMEMLEIIKGPDFPTGGYLLESSEIEKAYATGKGKLIMRAKVKIETGANDKKHIVITELPYQVNKADLLSKILKLRDERKEELGGISEIVDESDRQGMRAVIKVKKDFDAMHIVNCLYKSTDLQKSFSVNMVAIAGGKPRLMGLIDIIKYYVEYQREVIYKRTSYLLSEAKEREHILAGLYIAIKNIDEVIKIIKGSPSTSVARTRLRDKLSLSERQAQAVLDMRLAKLTHLEIDKLVEELKEIRQKIREYTEILADKKLQLGIVKKEMDEIKKRYRTARRSKIIPKSEIQVPIIDEDAASYKDGMLVVTHNGQLKQITSKIWLQQTKNKANSGVNELPRVALETNSEEELLCFTNKGNAARISLDMIPEKKWKERGIGLSALFPDAAQDEKIIEVYAYNRTPKKGFFFFYTAEGMVKKTSFEEYLVNKSFYQAMTLSETDEIIGVEVMDKDCNIFFATMQGMCLNAETNDIPEQGRKAKGVRGIQLSDGDRVICARQNDCSGEYVIVTDKGFGKRVISASIEPSKRYRKGLRLIDLNGKNGMFLMYCDYVRMPYDIAFTTREGELKILNTENIDIESRTTKGKALMKTPIAEVSHYAELEKKTY